MPMKAIIIAISTGLIAGILLTACGGSDAPTSTAGQSETQPTVTQTEQTSEDLSIPAEVAFAGQIAQSLLGTAITEEDQNCLFASATENEEFAEAISAVLDANASLTPTYFKSLITYVRDCVGQKRMSDAIALGLSLNKQNENLSNCLNETFVNDPTESAFVGLAAITAGISVPEEFSTATVDLLNRCVSVDVIAGQLSIQYEQLQSFTVAVNQECLINELNNFEAIENFWEVAFISQDAEQLEGISLLVESCEEVPFADLVQEIPQDFEPWSGQRTLAAVAPPARTNAYSEPPPMNLKDGVEYFAVIETNDGQMKFELLSQTAPIAVNNFVSLSLEGYYEGLIFHRGLENFMAQGGDPTGIGTGSPGYRFEDEVGQGSLFDERGILAMANSGPDTNGSQFFITFVPTPHLDGNYTIFGKLIEGDDVLARIELRDPATPTTRGELILSVMILEE